LKQAVERVRIYRPASICTDKPSRFQKVISDLNHRYDLHFYSFTHIDRKWWNNHIESDHVALKSPLGTKQSFWSLRSAKATLLMIDTIRTIKNGYAANRQPGVRRDIAYETRPTCRCPRRANEKRALPSSYR